MWKSELKMRESCLQEFTLLRWFHLTEVCGLSSLYWPAGINRNSIKYAPLTENKVRGTWDRNPFPLTGSRNKNMDFHLIFLSKIIS